MTFYNATWEINWSSLRKDSHFHLNYYSMFNASTYSLAINPVKSFASIKPSRLFGHWAELVKNYLLI